MVVREIIMKKPTNRSRKLRTGLLILCLLLCKVKNHRGKINTNNIILGLARTVRPKRIPEMIKIRGFPISSAKSSDAKKRRVKKITTVGSSRIPV